MSTVRYLLRLVGQSASFARSERRTLLFVVLVLAPLLVLVAFMVSAAAPVALYPFL